MRPADTVRLTLRAATASHHDRVDALFSTLNLNDRTDYGRFLSAQAAAHLPVERALNEGGAIDILDDWPERQRAASLLSDLERLGLTAPDMLDEIFFESPAAVLGGIYVLEGSRLGGTLLKRSVPDDFPSQFLGGVDSAAWRNLLALLEDRLRDPIDIDAACAAAARVFTLFERSGRHYLKMD